MANARNPKRKGHDAGRDQGGFIAMPWSVLDCPAYACLSHPARSLLVEVARQFVRDNNGRLLLSKAHMIKRGWKSADTIGNAKRELLAAGFIHETVQGHRPNKASWYAVTWRALDKIPGYDPGAAETFKRGAYQQSAPLKNVSLRPPAGTEKTLIAPPAGTGRPPTAPSAGAIKAVLPPLSAPPAGHHLELPSTEAELGAFSGLCARRGNYRRFSQDCNGLFTGLFGEKQKLARPQADEVSKGVIAKLRMIIGQQAVQFAIQRQVNRRRRTTLPLPRRTDVVCDGAYTRVRDGDQLPEGW